MTAAPEEPPPATPDFSARQIYLDAAPGGIDARWAWTQSGGRGRDVRIIDVEGNWRFTHEDLTQNQGGVVGGTPIAGVDWTQPRHRGARRVQRRRQHASASSASASDAIVSARLARRHRLGGGDQPGGDSRCAPATSSCSRCTARDRASTSHRATISAATSPSNGGPTTSRRSVNATSRGIIVVEAAGNGAENLDDALYQTAAPGFPAGWRNPFRRVQPRLGRHRRRRRRAASGHARPRPRPRPLAPRLLELGRADRRAGLGPRGDDLRLRRSAGRHQRGSLVHRHLQRHVERVAHRRRRDCLRCRAWRRRAAARC